VTFPHMPSWHSAYWVKHRENFTFYLYLAYIYIYILNKVRLYVEEMSCFYVHSYRSKHVVVSYRCLYRSIKNCLSIQIFSTANMFSLRFILILYLIF
jgi:hypothetical protein